MEAKQAAQDFLEKYGQFREILAQVAPMDEQISRDDLSSAHMEAMGLLGDYERLTRERSTIVSELNRIRSEVGEEALIAELKGTEGSEQALEYIYKTVPREEKVEVRQEVKKGLFGRFR